MDATLDFFNVLNDPSRWVVRPSVPIFKPHVRTDPATNQVINVDLPKLYRIASNMQRLERQGGVPIRMTLGHTEPGKPETEQPPVGGYYRNARVARFGPKGEPAVVVDEWLDPQYAPVRKNFPYRSAEYYDDAEQITGVALLTRDPFLDLGVVAYSREGFASYSAPAHGPVRYSAHGSPRPVYEYVTSGEPPMWPTDPNNPYGVYSGPAVPPAPAHPNYPPAMQPPAAVPAYAGPVPAASTPYAGGPNNPVRYDTAVQWPPVPAMGQGDPGWATGNQHNRHNIGHPHPSGGAIYDHRGGYGPRPSYPRTGYAGDDGPNGGPPSGPPPHSPIGGPPPAQGTPGMPPGMPGFCAPGQGMMPPPGPGGPGMPQPGAPDMNDPLAMLHKTLMDGAEHLSRYMAGRQRTQQYGAQAPMSPFPQAPMGYSAQSPPQPAPAGPPAVTTITGLPVGYQMKVDALQYQLRQSQDALRVLMYERDQSDTQWCIAEIRRLGDAGYAVDEGDIHELKATPRDHRPTKLQRIMAKYQRVGTDFPPPILGDPTPGEAPGARGPMTQEEMDAALRMTEGTANPAAYHAAVQAIRYGAVPGQQHPGFGPPTGQPADPSQYAWGAGNQAPQAFGDPYPEPSANGSY